MKNKKVEEVDGEYWILALVGRKLNITRIEANEIRIQLDCNPHPQFFYLNKEKMYTKDFIYMMSSEFYNERIVGEENLDN